MLSSLRINGSALDAERQRLDVISENIANAQTTRTPGGGPYRRKEVVFEAVAAEAAGMGGGTGAGGVRVAQISESQAPLEKVYNPGHPDADSQGYVSMPNVNIVEEMVDLVAASRAYEANVAAVNTTKSMISHAMELGRG